MNLVNKEYHKRARVLLENWQDRGVFPPKLSGLSETISPEILNLYLLKADASISEVNKLCKEARKYHIKKVCVNPALVARASQFTESDIDVVTVVGFPLGANHPRTKIAEAELAMSQGVKAIELVLNTGLLKTSNFQEVFEEIRAVRYACPEADLTVILETALLDPLHIIIGCMLCREAGVDQVKSATGFQKADLKVEDVSLMRFVLGEDLDVIAAGHVVSEESVLLYLKAGATHVSIEYLGPDNPLQGILDSSDHSVNE